MLKIIVPHLKQVSVGDKFLSINGAEVNNWFEIVNIIKKSK